MHCVLDLMAVVRNTCNEYGRPSRNSFMLAPLLQQTDSWNLHLLTSMHERERLASSPNASFPFVITGFSQHLLLNGYFLLTNPSCLSYKLNALSRLV
jgi:hypothetical protein